MTFGFGKNNILFYLLGCTGAGVKKVTPHLCSVVTGTSTTTYSNIS